MISSDLNVSVNYEYDTLNRLQHVVDSRLSGNQTTTYTYDDASNVTKVLYPNMVETDLTFDPLNRVTQLATSQTGYMYTLDAVGNRKTASEYDNRSVTWNFDDIYRLSSEGISGAPNNKNGSITYGLDPVGNRTSASSSIPGLTPIGGTFNQDDELSSETYDQNGNVLATGGKTFSYNSQNQLTSMNGGAVTIIYDGDGNRVSKTVSGVTTRYLVDDLNPTGYPQVVEELTNGAVSRTYTYGLARISQYQQVSGTWTPSFYGYDGFGTVRQLTNSSGAITDTYDYDAFGNKVNSTGTTLNNYLYRGEQFDPDLGLYYLRARYYNPNTGRFMSRDVADGDLSDPATLHKYLYAKGDPIDEMDPSGMASIPYPAPAPAQTRPTRSASEYAGIILNIAVRAIPAVAAVGCAANIAYTVDALRTPGGSTKAIKVDLPECSAHKDCTPYEEKIQEALELVKGRYAELLADIHGLYGLYCRNPKATTQWGSWTGHLYAYEQAQLDLQNAIADAKDAGCPVSPEAEEWATKPPPSCPE